MSKRTIIVALVGVGLAIGLAACGGKTVPDVVGMNPQEAIDAMHEAGLKTNSHGGIGAEEGTGFVVCKTEPTAGDSTGGKVEIFSSRDCMARSAVAKADVAEQRHQADSKPSRSESERVARKVAREFKSGYGVKGFEPSWYDLVTGFAKDLDPWDGSIEVKTGLYPDAEGEEFASEIGAGVLGVAYALGICKVDVMASDGSRLLEHESRGRACA